MKQTNITKKETQRKKKMLLQSKIRAKHTKCKKCKLNITQNNKMHAKQPTNRQQKKKKGRKSETRETKQSNERV